MRLMKRFYDAVFGLDPPLSPIEEWYWENVTIEEWGWNNPILQLLVWMALITGFFLSFFVFPRISLAMAIFLWLLLFGLGVRYLLNRFRWLCRSKRSIRFTLNRVFPAGLKNYDQPSKPTLQILTMLYTDGIPMRVIVDFYTSSVIRKRRRLFINSMLLLSYATVLMCFLILLLAKPHPTIDEYTAFNIFCLSVLSVLWISAVQTSNSALRYQWESYGELTEDLNRLLNNQYNYVEFRNGLFILFRLPVLFYLFSIIFAGTLLQFFSLYVVGGMYLFLFLLLWAWTFFVRLPYLKHERTLYLLELSRQSEDLAYLLELLIRRDGLKDPDWHREIDSEVAQKKLRLFFNLQPSE